MAATDVAGIYQLIIDNAKFIRNARNYDPSNVTRSSGDSDHRVYLADLFFHTDGVSTHYLGIEGGQRTSLREAMVSLLDKTAAMVDKNFEKKVVRVTSTSDGSIVLR